LKSDNRKQSRTLEPSLILLLIVEEDFSLDFLVFWDDNIVFNLRNMSLRQESFGNDLSEDVTDALITSADKIKEEENSDQDDHNKEDNEADREPRRGLGGIGTAVDVGGWDG